MSDKKRKRESMAKRGFSLLAVHTETAKEFRAASRAARVTQDSLMRSLLSWLEEEEDVFFEEDTKKGAHAHGGDMIKGNGIISVRTCEVYRRDSGDLVEWTAEDAGAHSFSHDAWVATGGGGSEREEEVEEELRCEGLDFPRPALCSYTCGTGEGLIGAHTVVALEKEAYDRLQAADEGALEKRGLQDLFLVAGSEGFGTRPVAVLEEEEDWAEVDRLRSLLEDLAQDAED